MDNIIVTTLGVFLIGFIYWFFFAKKEDLVEVDKSINIIVSGGYNPENIKVKVGKTTKIVFLRTDKNSCLEEVVLPDFKIKKYLPLNEKVEISITPKDKGQYQIHCGMNMFHGKVVAD